MSSPEEKLARWAERDAAVGLTAELDQARLDLAAKDAEIADLRARNEQLAQRVAQLRAERDHVTRLNRRLLKPSIPRRVVHRLRWAAGKLAR